MTDTKYLPLCISPVATPNGSGHVRSWNCRRSPPYRTGGGVGSPMAPGRISPKASHRPQRQWGGASPVCLSAVLKPHGSFEMSLKLLGTLYNCRHPSPLGLTPRRGLSTMSPRLPSPPQASPEAPRGCAGRTSAALSVVLLNLIFLYSYFFHPLLLASAHRHWKGRVSCREAVEGRSSKWKAESLSLGPLYAKCLWIFLSAELWMGQEVLQTF